jgi:hypothetical protein
MSDTAAGREQPRNGPEGGTSEGTRVPGSETSHIFRSTAFSIAFGIIAPIVCFALKPVLLPGDVFELPGLRFINIFWIFGYGVIGLGIASLAIWLWRGPRLGAWCGIVAGDLLACALFAAGLGIVLLPFSVIGLFAIIGVLGFVPFLTAATFGGNAIRAFRHARRLMGEPKAWATMVLGAWLVVGVPGALQSWASLTVRQAMRDVARGEASGMARLRSWYRFAHRDRLVWAYAAERDPVSKERLAGTYRELTGEDAEHRLLMLSFD